uniref:Tachykinin precursor 1 n=1 Tax=Echeneis naucrates TaxID=173247 RepID=A0A665TMA4_ECHNA
MRYFLLVIQPHLSVVTLVNVSCFSLGATYGLIEIFSPQYDWLSSRPFREILLRMTRKPRPHQFIGLMGKRSMANTQITRKRHKINSFIGLMGKRSQEEPESYEWSTMQTYDKRR